MTIKNRIAVFLGALALALGLGAVAASPASAVSCYYQVWDGLNYQGNSYCWGAEWYNQDIPVQTSWTPKSYRNWHNSLSKIGSTNPAYITGGNKWTCNMQYPYNVSMSYKTSNLTVLWPSGYRLSCINLV